MTRAAETLGCLGTILLSLVAVGGLIALATWAVMWLEG